MAMSRAQPWSEVRCVLECRGSAKVEPESAGPVAQSVERWTPYGGSIRPSFKSPGFEARRAPDVYRASWRVWLRLVAGRSQSKSAIGTGRARLCAYVKLSTLNSAIDPELRDRKVEDRANATSSAQRGALSLSILPIRVVLDS